MCRSVPIGSLSLLTVLIRKQQIQLLLYLTLSNTKKNLMKSRRFLSTDAGFGSEENYQPLEDKGIRAYVKHNQFDRQQNETIRDKKPFAADKLYYNKEKDCYYCPMGQAMDNIGTTTKTTSTGFKQKITIYQASNCEGCPLRGVCHKAKDNRTVEINYNLNRLKHQADELLLSEEGIRHRKQRPGDVEPVLGNINPESSLANFSNDRH